MKRIFAIVLLMVLSICALAEEALPHNIGLTSVGNARELGGYQTSDGRTVKHSVFLRTASLSNASDEDIQRLREDYHLSIVVDLRMTREIEAAPDPEIPGVRNLHLGIIDEKAMAAKQREGSTGDVEELDTTNKLEMLKQAIKSGVISDQMYVEWLSSTTGKAGYAQMFQELIDLPEGESLLFHCSQGKDRTGCAAMLILSALGVDEDTILEDFMLTNTYNAGKIESERQMLEEAGFADDELEICLTAMDEVDAQYMVNALDWMKKNYDSTLGYIIEELGVSEAEIEQLRDNYLN